MNPLEIYILNVGQGDSAIIKTPDGRVIVIDAYKRAKVLHVLDAIFADPQGAPKKHVSHLIVTHPHLDHDGAVYDVLDSYDVHKVTLPPFWYRDKESKPLLGGVGYRKYIKKIKDDDIPRAFLAGYQRSYPDGVPEVKTESDLQKVEDSLCLELLGPPNDLLEGLEEAQQKKKTEWGSEVLGKNHLSIMARLSYHGFSMVFAGDAQLENWVHYDREGLLEKGCTVLKAAHHGSKNGTQWERLDDLRAKLVIVSSDPRLDKKKARVRLPDMIGCAAFLKYERTQRGQIALTYDTGTIRLEVDDQGDFKAHCYGEKHTESSIPWANEQHSLPMTAWADLVAERLATSL